MPIKSKTILLGNKPIQKQGLVYTCLKKLSIGFLFLKKVDDKQRTHKIFTVHQRVHKTIKIQKSAEEVPISKDSHYVKDDAP